MKQEQKRSMEIRFTNIENITEYDTEDMQVLLGFDGITDPVLENSIWEQVEAICERHSWNPERVCLYLCLRGGKTGIAFETRFDDMHFIPVQLTAEEISAAITAQARAVIDEAWLYAVTLAKDYNMPNCLNGLRSHAHSIMDTTVEGMAQDAQEERNT